MSGRLHGGWRSADCWAKDPSEPRAAAEQGPEEQIRHGPTRGRWVSHILTRAANDPSVFTITEKAPTRAFSWLKSDSDKTLIWWLVTFLLLNLWLLFVVGDRRYWNVKAKTLKAAFVCDNNFKSSSIRLNNNSLHFSIFECCHFHVSHSQYSCSLSQRKCALYQWI